MESDEKPGPPADDLAEDGRADEAGDEAEPDAPTDAEQNEGLSSVLSADPLAGVQKDEGEQ